MVLLFLIFFGRDFLGWNPMISKCGISVSEVEPMEKFGAGSIMQPTGLSQTFKSLKQKNPQDFYRNLHFLLVNCVSFSSRCFLFVCLEGGIRETFPGITWGQFQRRPLYPNQKCLVVLARCGGLSCQNIPGGGSNWENFSIITEILRMKIENNPRNTLTKRSCLCRFFFFWNVSMCQRYFWKLYHEWNFEVSWVMRHHCLVFQYIHCKICELLQPWLSSESSQKSHRNEKKTVEAVEGSLWFQALSNLFEQRGASFQGFSLFHNKTHPIVPYQQLPILPILHASTLSRWRCDFGTSPALVSPHTTVPRHSRRNRNWQWYCVPFSCNPFWSWKAVHIVEKRGYVGEIHILCPWGICDRLAWRKDPIWQVYFLNMVLRPARIWNYMKLHLATTIIVKLVLLEICFLRYWMGILQTPHAQGRCATGTFMCLQIMFLIPTDVMIQRQIYLDICLDSRGIVIF